MAMKTAKKTAPGIKLGSLVKDSITGFTGIAVGRVEFVFGCIHIRVQGQGLTRDGAPISIHSFDDQRIDVIRPPAKSWPKPKVSTIKLGDTVRGTLNGVVGVVSGRSVGLDGLVTYIVERPGMTPDGDPKAALSIDSDRLEVVTRRKLKVSKDSVATSGGPMTRTVVAH